MVIPIFHTKTTQSIIAPLAQQIDHLIDLHQQGEDGNPIEPLDHLISNVQLAVKNLFKVGQETVEEAQDNILSRDMPPSLDSLQEAVSILLKAGSLIKNDPLSVKGRENLIEGAGSILQGTSNVLLAYDAYEVRKIIKICRGLIEFLDFARIVQTLKELASFINNLTPGMARMSSQVDDRANDLVYAPHREKLKMRLDDIKKYTPQLASSMKLAVSSTDEGQMLAKEEAIKQRDIVVARIVEALLDIIRTLQWTNLVREGIEPVDIAELKRTRDNMLKKFLEARKWLRTYDAPSGGPGELAVRCILSDANEIADRSGIKGDLADLLRNKSAVASKDTDVLCVNYRDTNLGSTTEGKTLSHSIEKQLENLFKIVDDLINKVEELQNLRDEINKLVEQAHEWLADPDAKPGPGTGSEAIHKILEKLHQFPDCEGVNIAKIGTEIQKNMDTLDPLRDVGQGRNDLCKNLSHNTGDLLNKLVNSIDQALSVQVPATELDGRIEQTKKWLGDTPIPHEDDRLGVKAARALIGQARKVAASCPDQELSNNLSDLATSAEGLMRGVIDNLNKNDEATAKVYAEKMDGQLDDLKAVLEDALTASIADKFSDTTAALKKLKAAAKSPKHTPDRDDKFRKAEEDFLEQAKELTNIARQAETSSRCKPHQQEAIRSAANKLDLLDLKL